MFALIMLQSFVTGLGDRLIRDEDGATAVEYALMVTLIAVAIIGAVTALGGQISTQFCNVVTALGGAC